MRIQALAIWIGAALALPAQAENITSTNPEALVEILVELGQTAELTADQIGDPLVRAEGESGPYLIWFYGCTANTRCTGVNFSAGFEPSDGATLELMNEWNAQRVVGRAYLDAQNSPIIDHYVVLGGGVTLLNFNRFVAGWSAALGEFKMLLEG